MLEVDYLIVGAGATAMAFTDVLIQETDARVVIVDREHKPGGHWNHAYPFVRLHQPSAYYGVNSRSLGDRHICQSGYNRGLFDLASSSEVCTYFDKLMQQDLLPSGRVQYFLKCEYDGDGQFHSLLSGERHTVTAKKVVDATFLSSQVPSTRPPPYKVESGVHCVPPNAVVDVMGEFDNYVVIGAGKTGIDTCGFLLQNGVQPDRISWIMPRDSWHYNRAMIQGGDLYTRAVGPFLKSIVTEMGQAESLDALFDALAESGVLLRLDNDIRPSMWRCSTVTTEELDQIRGIGNIVRLGRVKAIRPGMITLEGGELATGANSLYIDCTADGLPPGKAKPIFEDNIITLQNVRNCQPTFSAAFVAHVESTYADTAVKNELCAPVPYPNRVEDLLKCYLEDLSNVAKWSQQEDLQPWLLNSRLDIFTDLPEDEEARDLALTQLGEVGAALPAALENLQRLVSRTDQAV
ncbi:MAG: NAD(P)/FAD-dependent oxidoreductase [Gammaproteobacteria bacterium]|nr:MAG: NAD(P)/FAD-dependent oxidoreductase [Gammaproteobacteria bacterium]